MSKISRRNFLKLGVAAGAAMAVPWSVFAQTPPPPDKKIPPHLLQRKVKPADRQAAADRLTAMGVKPGAASLPKQMEPGGIPHYYGPYANYANSPMPKGAIASIALDAGGSGYVAPTVTIDDVYGTGSGATASAVLGPGGAITGITVDTPGSGYSAPIVTISGAGTGAAATAVLGSLTGGLRKFVDDLPPLGAPNAVSTLGKYIQLAVAEEVTYNSIISDYYEIALVEFDDQFHSDLPPTRLRGYVQLSTTANPGKQVQLKYPDGTNISLPDGSPALGFDDPRYLGPLIVSERDKPVRIKFYNLLPTGAGGDLFIPVDESVMGAGEGPVAGENYTQNRATVHLHGGLTPWISDGTPHQWTTPAGEATSYPKGVSVYNVPDMEDPGRTAVQGVLTFYYTNQQSARLMFYHDHAYGITRLNVYAGEVAGYLITDPVEQDLINGSNNTGVNPNTLNVLPDVGIPLIIQDKTFVDADTIPAQDPTWMWGTNPGLAGGPVTGDLWVPSVYMPAQNPWDPTGASAYGRWQYGPYFWPPTTPTVTPYLVDNPYYDPVGAPWEPPVNPVMPQPSMGMEAFNDTPVINGVAYPYMEVDPTVVRFRILNGANDRFFNLHFYVADPSFVDAGGFPTEVKMVPAVATPGFPATWSTDGRAGGVPDPALAGPSWIQIGTEGGFLPEPVVLPPQPLNWNMNATAFNVGNVTDHSLLLGCAERADVLVDFSQYAGQTLIMYNDAPAAFPALDPRYDYYTGAPDQTSSGGAPTVQPGYGPNIRTVMQVRVRGGAGGAGLSGVTVTNGGQDYDSAPYVYFTGGGGATADATCGVAQVDVVDTGSSYPSAPVITFNGGGGSGAAATAMVVDGYLTGIVVTNPGSGYTSAPTIQFDGTDTGAAVASLKVTAINLTNGGSYTSLPQVYLIGGGGNGAAAVAAIAGGASYDLATLQAVWAKDSATGKAGVFEASQDSIIVPQAAYNSAYDSAFPTDVAGQYVMLQNFDRVLDTYSLASITVVNGGSGYTDPIVTIAGGGDATATATVDAGVITGITLTNPGSGFTCVPNVKITDSTGMGASAVAVLDTVAAQVTLPLQPKAIHDEMNAAYDPEYGRMSGLLGLELPVTNALNQNLVLYGYSSPPIDLLMDSVTPLGTMRDGTQIWKITHNGVDTHPIHFHLVNVQLINRVAWDNALLPPEPNELGWKETVRINPLEHTIVAVRPMAPTLPFPFDLPNSVRPIDVTKPLDVPVMGFPPGWLDPAGNALTVTNHMVNYGWEFVWHCHILSHEEMDMMHALSFAATPTAPSNLAGTRNSATRFTMTWVNNAANATNFRIERANDIGFTSGVVTVDTTGLATTYVDNTVVANTSYYYRVYALNVVGDTTPYPAPAIGFPTLTAVSGPSNIAEMAVPAAPTLVSLVQTGTHTVTVTWTDNSTNETFFTVQRSNNGTSGWSSLTTTVAGSVPPSTTGGTFTYDNTNAQSNRTYYYRVLARNAFGTGAPSNVMSILTV